MRFIEVTRFLQFAVTDKFKHVCTTIHYTSNHPIEQKMAAFRYYINRLLTLPLTQEGKNKEWAEILNMAKSNRLPEDKITKNRAKKLIKCLQLLPAR